MENYTKRLCFTWNFFAWDWGVHDGVHATYLKTKQSN